jgi:hypothetical protein
MELNKDAHVIGGSRRGTRRRKDPPLDTEAENAPKAGAPVAAIAPIASTPVAAIAPITSTAIVPMASASSIPAAGDCSL